MKNRYDFDSQISCMNDIFDNNVVMGEMANTLLKKMCPEMLKRAVKQLKEEYEEKYYRTDIDKYNSIKSTLNLVARQKVCNIDELFMGLAFEINAYYRFKYLQPQKKIPYYMKCGVCDKYVSNHIYGIKSHEFKCQKKCRDLEKGEGKKKKAKMDTKEKYEQRQGRIKEAKSIKQQIDDQSFNEDDYENEQDNIKKSKKDNILNKKQLKEINSMKQKSRMKILDEKQGDGLLNFDKVHFGATIYYQDDDPKFQQRNDREQKEAFGRFEEKFGNEVELKAIHSEEQYEKKQDYLS